MGFEFEKTGIEGVLLVKPHIYEDERGEYVKHYEIDVMKEVGISVLFTESSDLYSKKGSLRGLHYQSEHSQAKLVHVTRGRVFDVALDLRENSPTYGKYFTYTLNDENHVAIYIPAGFAHGYISLTEGSIFCYSSSEKYIPEASGGIRWDDEELAIPWPLEEYGIEKVIMTEKDRTWPTFREYRQSVATQGSTAGGDAADHAGTEVK